MRDTASHGRAGRRKRRIMATKERRKSRTRAREKEGRRGRRLTMVVREKAGEGNDGVEGQRWEGMKRWGHG